MDHLGLMLAQWCSSPLKIVTCLQRTMEFWKSNWNISVVYDLASASFIPERTEPKCLLPSPVLVSLPSCPSVVSNQTQEWLVAS